MSLTHEKTFVKHAEDDNSAIPIAWSIRDLPQRVGIAYGIQLIYADGRTGQIAMSSRSHRGIRQQVRTHPRYGHLPERVVVAGGAVVATITQVRGGGRR